MYRIPPSTERSSDIIFSTSHSYASYFPQVQKNHHAFYSLRITLLHVSQLHISHSQTHHTAHTSHSPHITFSDVSHTPHITCPTHHNPHTSHSPMYHIPTHHCITFFTHHNISKHQSYFVGTSHLCTVLRQPDIYVYFALK